MNESSWLAITLALIGLAGSVWSAYIANRNKKETAVLTNVLANTKGPIDSLDQVIDSLQQEMKERENRYQSEVRVYEQRLDRLQRDLSDALGQLEICRAGRVKLGSELDRIKDELKKRGIDLDGPRMTPTE